MERIGTNKSPVCCGGTQRTEEEGKTHAQYGPVLGILDQHSRLVADELAKSLDNHSVSVCVAPA